MKTFKLLRTLMIIIVAVISALPSWSQDIDSLMLQFQQYCDAEEYEKAIDCCSQALQISVEKYGENSKEEAEIWSTIGDFCISQEYYEDAVDSYNQAKEIYSVLGNNTMIADMLSHMGECYYEQSDFENAIDCYSEALQISIENYGKNSKEVAEILYNIGVSCFYQENYEDAIDFFNQAKEIYSAIGDENSIAIMLESIGLCYFYKKDYEKAIDFFSQAKDIYSKIEGKNSINTANILLYIGDCYRQLNEKEKAMDCYRQAREIGINADKAHITTALELMQDVAKSYHYIEEYDKEVDTYYEVTNKYLETEGEHSLNAAQTLVKIGEECFCWPISDKNRAIAAFDQARDICINTNTENSSKATEILLDIASNFHSFNEQDKAIDTYTQAKEIFVKTEGENSQNAADMLYHIGECYSYQYLWKKEKESYYQARDIYITAQGEDITHAAKMMTEMGHAFFDYGEFDNGREINNQAKNLCAKAIKENPTKAAEMLEGIGDYYYRQTFVFGYKYYDDAIDYYEFAKDAYLKTNQIKAAELLSMIGKCYRYKGDWDKAIDAYSQAKEIYSNVEGNGSINAAYILINICDCYFNNKDNANAKKALDQAKVICRKAEKADISAITETLMSKGVNFILQDEHNCAIELYSAATELYFNRDGKSSIDAAKALSEIGRCHYMLNEPDKAKICFNQAKEICLNNDNKNTKDILKSIGSIYSEYNDYDNAIEYLSIIENKEENITTDIGLLLELFHCYYMLNQYDKANEYFTQATDIYRKKREEDNPTLDYISHFGNNYIEHKEYDNAIKILSFAKELYIESNSGKDTEFTPILINLGDCYFFKKDYNNAIDSYLLAINTLTYDEVFSNPDYYLSMCWDIYSNLALCYHYINQDSQAYINLYSALIARKKIIYTEYLYYYRKKTTKYWDDYSEWFQTIFPSLAIEATDINTGYLYNMSALVAKSFLLSTDNELQRLVYKYGSRDEINAYKQLQEVRANITKLSNSPEKHRQQDIENLKDQETSLYYGLKGYLRDLQEHEDFMQNMWLKWEDVQKNLSDNDIAIEFLSFQKLDTDSVMYIALTVKPGYDQPQMTVLCEEKELKTAAEEAYTTQKMSKLIWGKLSKELEGVKTIYFSPSGELHKIAIESMQHWDEPDSLMCNIYTIYRLSSTRELAMKRSDVEGGGGAVLYGGMKYNCPISVMEAALNENPSEDNSSMMTSATDDSPISNDFSDYTASNDIGNHNFDPVASMLRGGEWKNLKNTKTEVDSILPTLSQLYVVKLRSGTAATETSFKRLSGKKNKIIHIATHGFYWDEAKATEEAKVQDNSTARQESHEKTLPFVQMNNAMTRSGLVFSGGNHIRKGDSIPPGVDDGVLTAQEVANLDLRGLDLVVLSACQTGLGDIGSDGVFGLQRGFKKAGAQAIIMSLWPVHDKATREMMVKFYEGLKDGKTMQQAFHDAQKHVRDRESKKAYGRYYEDDDFSPLRPHWAAFILLDAVERQQYGN